jgi:hypothetical protein
VEAILYFDGTSITNLSAGLTKNTVNDPEISDNGQAIFLGVPLSGVNYDVFLATPDTDHKPPVLSVSAHPSRLWPPNGKMVSITVSGTITENDSGVNPTTARFSVADEYGRVQPSGAVSLVSGESYVFTTSLEASRRGNDSDGRQYIITVTAEDLAGNSGSASTVVTVPHDQREKM